MTGGGISISGSVHCMDQLNNNNYYSMDQLTQLVNEHPIL